jgi:hypothetical protein
MTAKLIKADFFIEVSEGFGVKVYPHQLSADWLDSSAKKFETPRPSVALHGQSRQSSLSGQLRSQLIEMKKATTSVAQEFTLAPHRRIVASNSRLCSGCRYPRYL